MKNEPNTQYLYKRQVLCPPASHACVMCRDKDIEIGQIKSENLKLHSDLMSANEKNSPFNYWSWIKRYFPPKSERPTKK